MVQANGSMATLLLSVRSLFITPLLAYLLQPEAVVVYGGVDALLPLPLPAELAVRRQEARQVDVGCRVVRPPQRQRLLQARHRALLHGQYRGEERSAGEWRGGVNR